jgi:hypothetical protein
LFDIGANILVVDFKLVTVHGWAINPRERKILIAFETEPWNRIEVIQSV